MGRRQRHSRGPSKTRIVAYLYADGFTGAARMGTEVLGILQPEFAYYGASRRGGVFQECASGLGGGLKPAPTIGGGWVAKMVSYLSGLVVTAGRAMKWSVTGADTVIVYGATVFALPLAALSLLPRVKTIIHLHETGTGRPWLDSLIFQFARLADSIVCVSRFHEGEVKKRLPNSAHRKLRLVYNCAPGIDAPPVPPNRDIPFIYAGGATRRKGIRVIAEVARRLAPRTDLRWQLCLSSAGDIDRPSVELLSRLPNVNLQWDVRDVPSYLRRARVAVFPTVPELCHESFGLVLLEAALCGCDVVASRSGAYEEILDSLGIGTTIPGSSEAELTQALAWLLPARSDAPNLVGPRIDGSVFSPARMADEWTAILGNLKGEVSA